MLSSEWVAFLRTVPLCLSRLLDPNRGAANADHYTSKYLALPDLQPNHRVCAFPDRFLGEPVDGLVAGLVYDAGYCLGLAPAAAEVGGNVFDKRFGVFARGRRSAMDGSEDADHAVAR